MNFPLSSVYYRIKFPLNGNKVGGKKRAVKTDIVLVRI